MIDFGKLLETELVLLRPLKYEDYEHFIPITSDQKMWIYFTSDLSDMAVLKSWIDSAIIQMIEKQRLAFTIVDKENNKVAGSTSLINISEKDQRIEIGSTWLSKEYQGKGFNDQAKYLMLKYCFDDLFFERVEFKTDVLNTPARKALVRIGATEEGVLRSHTLMINNRRRDTIYYSVLKSEWNDIKIKNNWL